MDLRRSGRAGVSGALFAGALVVVMCVAAGCWLPTAGASGESAAGAVPAPPEALRLSGTRAEGGVTTVDVVVPPSTSGRTLASDAFDVRLDGVPFGASVRRLVDSPLSVDLVLEVPTDPTELARLQGAAAEFVLDLPRTVAVRIVTGVTPTDFSLDRRAALDALRHLAAIPAGAAVSDAVVAASRPTSSTLEGARRLTVVVARTDPTAAVLAAVAVGGLDPPVLWVIRPDSPGAPGATVAQAIDSGDTPPEVLTRLSTSTDLLGAFDRVTHSVAGTSSISLPGAVGGSSVQITLTAAGRTSVVTTIVPNDGAAPRPPGPPEILPPVAREPSPEAVVAVGGPARASRVSLAVALVMVIVGAAQLLGRSRRARPSATPVGSAPPTAAQLRLRDAAGRARRSLHDLAAVRAAVDHPMPAAVVIAVEAVASARLDDPRVTVDDLVGVLDHTAAVPAPIAASHAHALRALAVPDSPGAWDRAMRLATDFDSGRSEWDLPTARSAVPGESLLDAVTAIVEQERVRSRRDPSAPRDSFDGSGAVGRSLLSCWPVRAGILDVPLVISPSLASLTREHDEPTRDRCDERSIALLDAVSDAARRMGDVERVHDALTPRQRSSPRDVADAVLAVVAVVDLRTVHPPAHVPT